MKCNYALKHMHSEYILVRTKHRIDEHIAHCSYCQKQDTSGNKVRAFLKKQQMSFPKVVDWSAFIHDIRRYREKREQKWRYRLANVFPLEPAYRRAVAFGAVCALIVFAYILTSQLRIDDSAQVTNELFEENNFYMQEHALTQNADLFGEYTLTEALISLEYE